MQTKADCSIQLSKHLYLVAESSQDSDREVGTQGGSWRPGQTGREEEWKFLFTQLT